jgi:hypothetical protein
MASVVIIVAIVVGGGAIIVGVVIVCVCTKDGRQNFIVLARHGEDMVPKSWTNPPAGAASLSGDMLRNKLIEEHLLPVCASLQASAQ